MNESWRRILTANIMGNLNDMLKHRLITQAKYDRVVAILEPEDADWYEHPRAWRPGSEQVEAVDEGTVPF